MRLIITRPEEDALPLQAKLEAMGHEARLLPMLQIVPVPDVQLVQKPYQAICVTSANALRAITPANWMRALPLLTVGPQSLAEAQALGFGRASAHGGNVKLLAQHIARTLKPNAGPLLYLAGDQVSADLHGLLNHDGFSVDKFVVYTAEPVQPQNLAEALQWAEGVLLYSTRSARLFASSVSDASLGNAAARLTCYCLSPNVALALPVQWSCRVAKQANEEGMLAMLEHGSQTR